MNIVGIGGGHGLSSALAALRLLGLAPTAVVTVADDGGSTGRLRQEHGVIALGDMRRALVTLARHEALAQLWEHRFAGGELDGHALGNLALLALMEQNDGDAVQALDQAARLLDCQGRVLPCTVVPVQLRAMAGGREVGGQVRIATVDAPVERVWLSPEDPPAPEPAIAAIRSADIVILGPGSLFTSIIATVIVPGITQALAASAATVVMVGNLLTQPGETEGFDASRHIKALLDHVPGLRVDHLVLHDGPVVQGRGRPLTLPADIPGVRSVMTGDLASRGSGGIALGIHEPASLAAVLAPLVGASLP